MSSITNAQLAAAINDLIQRWRRREEEIQAWMAGPAGGGDGGDGRYPLTDYLGNTILAKSPAQLEADVEDLVVGAAGYKNAAEAAAAQASFHASAASDATSAAVSAKDAAEAARVAAETAQSYAENARNIAVAQANKAVQHATNAATSETNAAASADAAAVSEANAAASAAAAAASAAAAATFDPELFYSKDEADTRFALASHSHDWADISGAPATATRWPSWSEVTSKPSTFPPASHTHSASDITTGTLADARLSSNVALRRAFNEFTGIVVSEQGLELRNDTQDSRLRINIATGGRIYFAPWYHGAYNFQREFGFDPAVEKWYAEGGLTDASITQSSVKQHEGALSIAWSQLTDLPAYATRWPSWSEVTGKPATFPPSSHTHSASEVSGVATLTGNNAFSGLNTFVLRNSPENAVKVYRENGQNQHHALYGDSDANWLTSFSALNNTKPLILRATTNEAGDAGTYEPFIELRGRSNTRLARFDDTAILFNKNTSITGTLSWGGGNVIASSSLVALRNTYNEFAGQVDFKDAIVIRNDAEDARLAIRIITGGRLYMAPWYNGGYHWNREFGFNPAVEQWYAEGGFTDASITQSSVKQHEAALSIGWAQLTGVPAYATRWPTWSEVTGKPSTFTPSSHTHDWGDITGLPAYATRWPSWSEVTGKPSTFAPSAHTHSWSDITGLPAYATRWPSWSEVTGKPSTFPPSSHTHTVSQITDLAAHYARLGTNNEFLGDASFGNDGTRGYVYVGRGASYASGYIGIHRPDGSRIGYIGWNTDSFAITTEGGFGISLNAPGGVFYYDRPMLRHSGAFGSGVVHVSFSAPSGGSDGDIWFQLFT